MWCSRLPKLAYQNDGLWLTCVELPAAKNEHRPERLHHGNHKLPASDRRLRQVRGGRFRETVPERISTATCRCLEPRQLLPVHNASEVRAAMTLGKGL